VTFAIQIALWSAVAALLVFSARVDWRERIIPNEAVLAVAVCAIALGLLTRPGSVWISLSISVVLFAGLWILANRDFLGGGDAKLIAAVTLLVPPNRVGMLLIAIALAGGVVSLAYLAAAHAARRMPAVGVVAVEASRPARKSNRMLRGEVTRVADENSVPYALAVLGGVGFHVASELYRCLCVTSCSP
jgi:prepilin peptidase CpaA